MTIEEGAKEYAINIFESDCIENTCKAYKNEIQRLKKLFDESVGVPANRMPVDKSMLRIRLEMYEDN